MRPVSIVAEELIFRFKMRRKIQVEGYNQYSLIEVRGENLVVTREQGKGTKIPKSRIIMALDKVRKNPSIYEKGPKGIDVAGPVLIPSPIWVILHLMTLEEINA